MTVKKIIAIDGPAGAGKSTVAQAIAARLGYLYIDTGAMYRTVAYIALQRGIALTDSEGLGALAGSILIDLKIANGQPLFYADGVDVTQQIRSPQVGAAASPVSAVSAVRRHLVAQQQRLAERGGVVMDGRDIGTVVLPHADCKVYLTAQLATRAQRRFLELQAKGLATDVGAVERDIAERDARDMNRADSPLKQAEDAVLVDTTYMTIAQAVDKVWQLAGGQDAAVL